MKMLINCWWRCWLTGYTLPEKKCISVNLVHSTRSRVRFDCPSTEALRKVQVSHILLSACASEEGGEGGGEYGKSLEQSMTEARWYVAFTVLEAKLLLCQQRMLFDMLGRWHGNNTTRWGYAPSFQRVECQGGDAGPSITHHMVIRLKKDMR